MICPKCGHDKFEITKETIHLVSCPEELPFEFVDLMQESLSVMCKECETKWKNGEIDRCFPHEEGIIKELYNLTEWN